MTLKNDLMLLRMDQPAQLGDTVKVIPMPKECAPVGTMCMVSGWGTTTFPEGKDQGRALLVHLQEVVKGLKAETSSVREAVKQVLQSSHH